MRTPFFSSGACASSPVEMASLDRASVREKSGKMMFSNTCFHWFGLMICAWAAMAEKSVLMAQSRISGAVG